MNIVKLKENHEFRRAYARGKSYVSPSVVVYVLKNRTGGVRLGITASKKLGCAVKRNRAKRVITAAFRSCSDNIVKGYDFVIVARSKILCVKSTAVSASLAGILKKAGVLHENSNHEQPIN